MIPCGHPGLGDMQQATRATNPDPWSSRQLCRQQGGLVIKELLDQLTPQDDPVKSVKHPTGTGTGPMKEVEAPVDLGVLGADWAQVDAVTKVVEEVSGVILGQEVEGKRDADDA